MRDVPTKPEAQAWDFVKELEQTSNADAVLDLMERYLSLHKYRTLMVSKIPYPGERLDDVVIGIRWPAEFLEIYRESRYEQDDPLFYRCRHSLFPFVWSESMIANDASDRGREMLRTARAFDIVKGFAVPIHGPKGFVGCVRMSGSKPDTDSRTIAFLHLLAQYGFKRLLGTRNPHAFHSPLTQREQEVLKLVALGQSARSIGAMLSITKRTADEHASNAVRKLGATNRTHAVAIAIRDKVIEL